MRPLPISIDDYFIDRELTPLDESNCPDFEHIEAVDLPLFNEHLLRLIEGDTVEIPTFNFVTGRREYSGKTLRLGKNQPLIIEGIHGLNETLTRSIPRRRKFKIYISALTALNIDRHTRIHTTDTRLLRRIIRDAQFRGKVPWKPYAFGRPSGGVRNAIFSACKKRPMSCSIPPWSTNWPH